MPSRARGLTARGQCGLVYGCVSAVDWREQEIFVAGAHCGDGKRFVVQADEKLTAFWN